MKNMQTEDLKVAKGKLKQAPKIKNNLSKTKKKKVYSVVNEVSIFFDCSNLMEYHFAYSFV